MTIFDFDYVQATYKKKIGVPSMTWGIDNK